MSGNKKKAAVGWHPTSGRKKHTTTFYRKGAEKAMKFEPGTGELLEKALEFVNRHRRLLKLDGADITRLNTVCEWVYENEADGFEEDQQDESYDFRAYYAANGVSINDFV